MSTQKITDYTTVVCRQDYNEEHINILIKDGWQPFGSPSCLPSDFTHNGRCVQVMVKYSTSMEGSKKN